MVIAIGTIGQLNLWSKINYHRLDSGLIFIPLKIDKRPRDAKSSGSDTSSKGDYFGTYNYAWRSKGGSGRLKETRLTYVKRWTVLTLAEAMGEAKDRGRWKRKTKASMCHNGPAGYRIP